MRKLLISILLASAAATPALADPGDHSDRSAERAARSEARSQAHADHSDRGSGERSGSGNHFNGAVANGGQGRVNGAGGQVQSGYANHMQGGQARAVEAEHAAVQDVRPAPGAHVVNNAFANGHNFRGGDRRQIEAVDEGQDVRHGPRAFNNDLRQSDRPIPEVMRTHGRTPVVSDVPRPGTQPPLRNGSRHAADVHWNTNWRNDGHHDWHHWRNHHHSWFHLGLYYDPFGWGYQPYSVGWRMWPAYYGNSFWINDPWQYRLPYAPPGAQWVRYYNDAVLVDMYTGEVLDVVYNFFW